MTIAILFLTRVATVSGLIAGTALRLLPARAKCWLAQEVGHVRDRVPRPVWALARPASLGFLKGLFFSGGEHCVLRREIATGLAMELDVAQKTQRLLYVERVYESSLTSYFARTVMPGDGFVDVGANVGYFTLRASRWVGSEGVVYAFEPERNNFERLKHHESINRLGNTVVFHAAAGATAGVLTLNLNPLNEGGHSLQARAHYYDDGRAWTKDQGTERFPAAELSQNVHVVALDAIVPHDGRRWHMKIDVEGAELDVLRGAQEFIARARPDICCEISAFTPEFRNLLDALSYDVYRLCAGGFIAPAPHVQSGNYILRPR